MRYIALPGLLLGCPTFKRDDEERPLVNFAERRCREPDSSGSLCRVSQSEDALAMHLKRVLKMTGPP
jgi:hypothetical protein